MSAEEAKDVDMAEAAPAAPAAPAADGEQVSVCMCVREKESPCAPRVTGMRGAEGPSPLCSGPRRRAKRREERGRVGRPSPSFPPTDALGRTSSLTHGSLSLSLPSPAPNSRPTDDKPRAGQEEEGSSRRAPLRDQEVERGRHVVLGHLRRHGEYYIVYRYYSVFSLGLPPHADPRQRGGPLPCPALPCPQYICSRLDFLPHSPSAPSAGTP